MKLKKTIEHKVKIENEYGDVYDIVLRPDDMVQMGLIGKAIKVFDDIEAPPVDDDLEKMLEVMEKVASDLKEVNSHLDMAFGLGFTEKMFKGSYAITMYDDFFNGIADQLEITERKAQQYIKERRKKVPQDHKPKDTL